MKMIDITSFPVDEILSVNNKIFIMENFVECNNSLSIMINDNPNNIKAENMFQRGIR